jgi:hypothetical protein
VRQLAGVLMRKKIVGHWGKLSNEEAEQMKKTLLDVVVNDPVYVRVVDCLVCFDDENNEWIVDLLCVNN